MSALLEPYVLGPFTLRNRVVMAPLTRNRASAGGVPPLGAEAYYRQRAGAGLIIAEATNITAQARGAVGTPGLWTSEQVDAWARVTRTVHAEGGLIFSQLWHTGRKSRAELQPGGQAPVAPSAIAAEGQTLTAAGRLDYSMPRALLASEIPGVVADYARAAERAMAAGFDGVEIHAANNYLIEQFIRDSANIRTDVYGGAIANRLRFPLAVLDAVVAVCGADRTGIRLSPWIVGGAPCDSDIPKTYGALLDAIEARGLLYIHVVEGATTDPRRPNEATERLMRPRPFSGSHIANNGYSQADAEAAIRSGHADLVSFGRLFIANPDLVERFRRGGPFAEAPRTYWYGGGSLGYADWPALR